MTAPNSMVDERTIQQLEDTAFLSAIPSHERKTATSIATSRRAAVALGTSFKLKPEPDWSSNAEDSIRRLTLAYELTAGVGLELLLRQRTTEGDEQHIRAAMFCAFDLRLAWQMPEDSYERALHVLSIAAYGYLGDRWQDARRYLRETQAAVRPLELGNAWEDRLLEQLFSAWVSLVRKNDTSDLLRVAEIITALRKEQSAFEPEALRQAKGKARGAKALRLLALYHWAKATEIVGAYMLQGTGSNITTDLEIHFGQARKAAAITHDAALDVLLRHLHVCSVLMVRGSIWQLARMPGIPKDFVSSMPKRGMFEMLPPQRSAIFDSHLLDPALHTVVVELPTSGGKTQLAELRMMQTLDSMKTEEPNERGWIAYIAPTRALVDQVTRRLRSTFGALHVRVDRLSGAIDIDPFEEALFDDNEQPPDIVVCTPEKLTMVLRGKSLRRPLRLVVVDEAHNIEDEERGIGLELLLAEIRAEHPESRFLLLMPHVPDAERLERWLSQDSQGKTISLSTTAWQPNERVVGLVTAARSEGKRGAWRLEYESLVTPRRTVELKGRSTVQGRNSLAGSFSTVAGSKTKIATAMAVATVDRGTAIVLCTQVPWARTAALTAFESLEASPPSPEILRIQRFLRAELGSDTEVARLLDRRVGIHHAQLSEETRALMEQLAEEGELRVLAATMTLAQGLNFPVSAVYLQDYKFFDQDDFKQTEMTPLAFWNLAGRAGRIQQGQMGIIGIACKDEDESATRKFVSRQLGTLISGFERLIKTLRTAGRRLSLEEVRRAPEWADFRSFVAHLVNQKKALDRRDETERLLRNTLAFQTLQADAKKDQHAEELAEDLINATREYAAYLRNNISEATSLADATGFDPESIVPAIAKLSAAGLKGLEWSPSSLFKEGDVSRLAQVIGIAMQLPQFEKLAEHAGNGMTHEKLARLAQSWVNGSSLDQMAREYFADDDKTRSLNTLCKAVYKALATYGTWSLAGLGTLSVTGRSLSDEQRRQLNLVPAFLYYGVNSEDAVALRMQGVPRTVAPALARSFANSVRDESTRRRPRVARDFLQALTEAEWQKSLPKDSQASGADYRAIWLQLSGHGAHK